MTNLRATPSKSKRGICLLALLLAVGALLATKPLGGRASSPEGKVQSHQAPAEVQHVESSPKTLTDIVRSKGRDLKYRDIEEELSVLAKSPDVPASEKLEILKRIADVGVSATTLEEIVGALCKSCPNDVRFQIEAIGYLKSGTVKLALVGGVFRNAGMADLPELSALLERYPNEEMHRRWLADLSKRVADANNVIALHDWFRSGNHEEASLVNGFCNRLREKPDLTNEIPFASVKEIAPNSDCMVALAQVYAADCLERGDRSGLQSVMDHCSPDLWYLVLVNSIAEMEKLPASFEDDIEIYVQGLPRASDREDLLETTARKRSPGSP